MYDCPLDLCYSYDQSGLSVMGYGMNVERCVSHKGPGRGGGGNIHFSPPLLLSLTGGNGWETYKEAGIKEVDRATWGVEGIWRYREHKDVVSKGRVYQDAGIIEMD